MKLDTDLTNFDKKLIEHKEEEEKRFIKLLSERYNIPVLSQIQIDVDSRTLQLVSEEKARSGMLAPFKKVRKKLSIAIHDTHNETLKETLRMLEGKGYTYELFFVTQKTLDHIWEYYKEIVATSASIPGTLTISNTDLEEAQEKIRSIEDGRVQLEKLKNLSNTRKISKNIEYVISTAIALKASDIHLEVTNVGGMVRYRLDGVLHNIVEFNQTEFRQLVVRLKLISGMKISSKIAQDGAFVIRLKEKVLSVRTSVIPEEDKDSFVIRILDPDNIIVDLEGLGLHPAILKVFKKNIKKPHGLILTTGPTGSGKTTTLYSFLNTIKKPGIKIITLEDPIEYRMSGIVQTQINKKYSFETGLRSILRQDPDVILVGEIRDDEVANTSLQAALTGHLVFSTLHTNDALGTLSRLSQFEIDTRLFSRAINIVIAQRLVRLLCSECSEKHHLTEEEKKTINAHIEELPESYKTEFSLDNIRKTGSGTCTKCIHGYRGRTGIFEVFEVDDEVENAFHEAKGSEILKKTIQKQNLPFMKDDALWKILHGETSIEEVERVLGAIL